MFNPKFKIVYNLEEAADIINRPHEDYPYRVRATEEALDFLTNIDNMVMYYDEFVCKAIHSQIMWNEDFRGQWRELNVTVGRDVPPDWNMIPMLMNAVFPFKKASNLDEIKDWYRAFETIHPFQDGNGRVGGIIMAAMSYNINPSEGAFLVPDSGF